MRAPTTYYLYSCRGYESNYASFAGLLAHLRDPERCVGSLSTSDIDCGSPEEGCSKQRGFTDTEWEQLEEEGYV